MKTNLTTAVGLAVVLLAGAAIAVGQPVGAGEGGPGYEGFGGPGAFLGLSDDQQEAARQIFEQRRPEMQALHEQLRENHKLLRDALESGMDPASVGELVIEGHALRERGRALREESKQAFERLLTPDQKRKLEMLEAARAVAGPRGPRREMGPRGGVSGQREMGSRRRDWGPPGTGSAELPDHR